jgi:hypothetical protein
MNGNDIKTLIDGLSPGGVLTLKPGGIPGAPRIDALVTQSFGGTLTATLGEANVDATSVTYAAAKLASATYLFYPVAANVPATLTFSTGSDGALDLSVDATMPAGWTLGASFPPVAALPNSALNTMAFADAAIAVASAQSPSAALVGATVDNEKSPSANFEFLLGKTCAVTGGATVPAGGNGDPAPTFNLSSAKIAGPSVSGFTLDLFLNLSCKPSPLPTPDGSTPLTGAVNLTTELVTPGLTVPILIGITAADQTSYTVTLDTSGGVPAIQSLDQLTGFTYGASPAAPLTATKTPIGTLALDYLFATINTASWSISNLQFEISLGTDWTVMDGLFELKKLTAAVTVPVVWNGGTTPPTGSSAFALVVGCDFFVATAPLEATISYPDVILTLGLQEGAVIDIDHFLQKFSRNLSLPGTASDMTVVTLSAVADISHSSYSLSAAANGSLTVIPGFTLTEFDMSILYASGGVQAFEFGCNFTIAKAPLALNASYTAPNWLFAGGTEPGQGINMSDLVVDIAGIFGVHLPNDLPEIVLAILAMTYATQDGAFSFQAEIDHVAEQDPILKKITGAVAIDYAGSTVKTWTGSVQGTIEVGSNLLTVVLDFQKDSMLAVEWKAEGDEVVTIADLCGLVGITPPDIPEGFDLDLVELDGVYNITEQVLALGVVSRSWGLADVVIWYDATGRWQFYFGLATSKTISLSALPLVGSEIAKFGQVSLDDIEGMAAVPALSQTAAGKILPTIAEMDKVSRKTYPQPPQAGLPNGVALSLDFDVSGSKTPISIGTSPAPSPSPSPPPSPPPGGLPSLPSSAPVPTATPPARPSGGTPATASDGTKWFAVQQSIGPVAIQKVGLRYSDSKLWALMNASVTVGGLELGLLGLGMGSPLSSFDPSFTVSGVTASLQVGEIAFSGALVGSIDPVNLYGEMSLDMGPVALGALAGYAPYEGDPSFFLYAVLDAPIGGPSFFFVTGVSAGFGINRQLLIPDITGVATFPLVQWAVGTNAPSSTPSGNVGDQVMQTMTSLTQSGVIAPAIGNYWFGVGLRFTSFELLDTFALVTVSLSKDFELDLLGLSSLSLPPEDPAPIARAQLALKASFKPSQGLLSIQGQLTNASYVLSKSCHLTGGFAFYLWYSGTNAGQFVVTLGGYSPHFTPPKDYPVVPRLGLNWQVTGDLSITGGEYFALTASAVMAGGSLSAVWQSGGLRAWFDVQADFLLVFQPLHYYISASIDLGASFSIDLWFTTITMSIHIGVGAEIWGPDFSGEIDVDLDIISFTISFGDASPGGQTKVGWPTFTQQLLPKVPQNQAMARQPAMLARFEDEVATATPPPVLQINGSIGILQTFDPSTGLDWLVDGHSFQCAIVSNVPLKTYEFLPTLPPDAGKPRDPNIEFAPAEDQPKGDGTTAVPNTSFGVGPVDIASDPGAFKSDLTLQITTTEDSIFRAVMLIQNIAKAMWQARKFDANGVPQNVDPLNDTTINNVLTGFTLVPYVPPPDVTLPILLENLQYTIDPALQPLAWSAPTVETSDPFDAQTQTVQNTIGAAIPTANRAAMIAAINRSGFAVATAVDVTTLADPATTYLLAQPALRYLGQAS